MHLRYKYWQLVSYVIVKRTGSAVARVSEAPPRNFTWGPPYAIGLLL